ncbi:MAG: transglutaminase family protein [Candidatus Dadabacteria bacterium]|nr:transglutaminase family protein [Candidatus Dadabacteria bacterium]
MLLSIDHNTTYSYGKKVVLAPHIVRLRPRDGGGQMTHMFSLKTDPPDAGRSVNSDLDGNTTVTLWFTGECDSLAIDTHCVVETLRENPFDFIVSDTRFLDLPMQYPPEQKAALGPYLSVSKKTALAVTELRETILSRARGRTTDFILSLCEHIHKNFPHVVRDEGAPWPAERTLREKRGSCRDLVELFAGICRSAGLACRHVSGYALSKRRKKGDELHAWAEVYIPGGGWRGYDPSSGLAVSDRHVAVASGATSGLIAPVSGSFYGDGTKAELQFRVKVRKTSIKEKKALGLL